MTHPDWNDIDAFITDALVPEDDALRAAIDASHTAGLPDIRVSAAQAKQLALLARAVCARRILEIGTLGGYSAIWLARAMVDGGRLTTIEVDDRHADVAQASFDRANVADRINLVRGRALDVLPRIAETIESPFDFVFIDADKENIVSYLDWSLTLTRPGALIVVDNVVRKGRILDPAPDDDSARGARAMYDLLRDDPRLDATVIQTVGAKGHDGYLVGVRTG
ncbi:MAG: O-methyltransferase [Phycisphaerales bacterium]